jgi:hypothetical protein
MFFPIETQTVSQHKAREAKQGHVHQNKPVRSTKVADARPNVQPAPKAK